MKLMPISLRIIFLVGGLGMTLPSFAEETGTAFADEFTVRPDPVKKAVGQDASSKTVDAVAQKKKRKCFKCGGSGLVMVSARETCDRCDGAGIVVLDVELKDTEHTFDGWWGSHTRKTTRKAYSKQPCPRCDRRGKITVKKGVECSVCKGKGEL